MQMSRNKYRDSESRFWGWLWFSKKARQSEAYVALSGVTRPKRERAQARDLHTEYSVTAELCYSLQTVDYLVQLSR
jgi:hypothetical protein